MTINIRLRGFWTWMAAPTESPCHGVCFHGVWVWWLGIWTRGLQRMGCCAREGACVTRSSAVDEAWNGAVAVDTLSITENTSR